MFAQFEDDAVVTCSNAPCRGFDVDQAADVCVAGFGEAIERLMDSSCGDGVKGDEVFSAREVQISRHIIARACGVFRGRG